MVANNENRNHWLENWLRIQTLVSERISEQSDYYDENKKAILEKYVNFGVNWPNANSGRRQKWIEKINDELHRPLSRSEWRQSILRSIDEDMEQCHCCGKSQLTEEIFDRRENCSECLEYHCEDCAKEMYDYGGNCSECQKEDERRAEYMRKNFPEDAEITALGYREGDYDIYDTRHD
jgi:hypothetical protein